jgi:hypothetical protein
MPDLSAMGLGGEGGDEDDEDLPDLEPTGEQAADTK